MFSFLPLNQSQVSCKHFKPKILSILLGFNFSYYLSDSDFSGTSVLITVLGEEKYSKEENTVWVEVRLHFARYMCFSARFFRVLFKMIHLTFLSLAFGTVFPALDTTTKLPEAPFPFT